MATVLGAGPAVGSWTGLMQMGEEKTNSEGHFRGTGGSITQGSESECECECECVGEALRMGEGGSSIRSLRVCRAERPAGGPHWSLSEDGEAPVSGVGSLALLFGREARTVILTLEGWTAEPASCHTPCWLGH